MKAWWKLIKLDLRLGWVVRSRGSQDPAHRLLGPQCSEGSVVGGPFPSASMCCWIMGPGQWFWEPGILHQLKPGPRTPAQSHAHQTALQDDPSELLMTGCSGLVPKPCLPGTSGVCLFHWVGLSGHLSFPEFPDRI